VLAGRNRAKLEILAEDLGGDVEVSAVGLDDPGALRRLLEPCAAVIACAGPFVRHGEPILAAAVEAGAHYVDTTGEQAFMRTVFDEYGPRAERAGVALVTAMGFDYVPGDMIASLTAAGLGPLEEVVLAYTTPGFGAGGPTRGTALSALDILSGTDWEWHDGHLVEGSQSVGRGTWEFPEPIGRQQMIRYPAGEHLTVPRHVETRRVRTMLSASAMVPVPFVAGAAPLAMIPVQLALRTPLRRAAEAVIPRLPEGPSEESRRRSRFTIVCEAVAASERRRGVVSGKDPYGLTARMTVEGALRLAAPGYERSGALAPSEAFESADFLDSLRDFEVEYEVGID
jgi:short subunit dehydrogenase-like uncharacterized protein